MIDKRWAEINTRLDEINDKLALIVEALEVEAAKSTAVKPPAKPAKSTAVKPPAKPAAKKETPNA